MKQNNKRFFAEKPEPVYDERGNIKYYQDNEYAYFQHKGELLDINRSGLI